MHDSRISHKPTLQAMKEIGALNRCYKLDAMLSDMSSLKVPKVCRRLQENARLECSIENRLENLIQQSASVHGEPSSLQVLNRATSLFLFWTRYDFFYATTGNSSHSFINKATGSHPQPLCFSYRRACKYSQLQGVSVRLTVFSKATPFESRNPLLTGQRT